MDNENNGSTISGRRNPRTVLRSPSPSPRLRRSKSGSNLSSLTTTPENSSRRLGSSQRFVSNTNRSKSTSKTRRTCNNEESLNPTSSSTSARKSQEIISNTSSNRSDGVGSSKRVTAKSPSAWALSPGRFLGSPAVSTVETPGKVKSNSNGVSKVLKYFRQKKVSSVQEDEHHRFRIMHNRLLQWRFVNARAQAAMVNVRKASEMNLFNVCLRNLMLRKRILEKKMERQKVKHIVKINQLVNPQVCVLNEWEKLLDKQYEEHINRLIRKLSALSICLPCLDIKEDVASLYQAMKTALEIMDSIDPLIEKYQSQVDRILYQVTEISTISKQQEEYIQELLRIIPIISTSMENEKSVMVHLIQTNMKLNIYQRI